MMILDDFFIFEPVNSIFILMPLACVELPSGRRTGVSTAFPIFSCPAVPLNPAHDFAETFIIISNNETIIILMIVILMMMKLHLVDPCLCPSRCLF